MTSEHSYRRTASSHAVCPQGTTREKPDRTFAGPDPISSPAGNRLVQGATTNRGLSVSRRLREQNKKLDLWLPQRSPRPGEAFHEQAPGPEDKVAHNR